MQTKPYRVQPSGRLIQLYVYYFKRHSKRKREANVLAQSREAIELPNTIGVDGLKLLMSFLLVVVEVED